MKHSQSLWRPQSHIDEMGVGGAEGGGQRTPWWPIWECSKLTLLSWRSAQCTGSTLDCPNEETCDVNRAGKAALYASSTLFTLFGISETAPCLRLFSWGHQCAAGVQPRAKIQEDKRSKASGFQVKSDSSIWEDFKSGCEGTSFCYILTLYSGWLGIARVLRGESSRWILKIGMSWMEAAKNIP